MTIFAVMYSIAIAVGIPVILLGFVGIQIFLYNRKQKTHPGNKPGQV